MAASKAFKIGLILGSTRPVRIAPQVASFILDTLARDSKKLQTASVTLDRIDLVDQGLPMFDEDIIPQHVKEASGYTHEHTRAWSRRIAACDSFIIVSGQRNWSIPAELKNSIDFLYHEWTAKPILLVTYGGHGGEQAADHLRTVFTGLKARPMEKGVAMTFEGREFATKAFKGEHMGFDAAKSDGPWSKYQSQIVEAVEELVDLNVAER